MSALNELEREVLTRLTSGAGRDFECLRQQVEQVQAHRRTQTGVGFYVGLSLSPTAAALSDSANGTLSMDAECDAVKHGLGFIAFLRGGRLVQLECFTYAAEPLGEIGVANCLFGSAPSEIVRAQ